MATINTPKHTDPVTKNKEKANEAEAKDKLSGKTKKPSEKVILRRLSTFKRPTCPAAVRAFPLLEAVG